MQLPTNFFHIDAGNMLTWIVVAVAWIAARGMDWRSLQDRTKWVEMWQKEHEAECKERSISMKQLEASNTKLTLIAEMSERRMNNIEKKVYNRRD